MFSLVKITEIYFKWIRIEMAGCTSIITCSFWLTKYMHNFRSFPFHQFHIVYRPFQSASFLSFIRVDMTFRNNWDTASIQFHPLFGPLWSHQLLLQTFDDSANTSYVEVMGGNSHPLGFTIGKVSWLFDISFNIYALYGNTQHWELYLAWKIWQKRKPSCWF